MNVDYNAYEGFEVQGIAETVISRGKVIVNKCEYTGKKGDGQFVKRSLYNENYPISNPIKSDTPEPV